MTPWPTGDARLVLLTPRGPGGVAVVAIDGPGRDALARRLLRTPSGAPLGWPGSLSVPRVALLCPGQEPLDEVLLVERRDRWEIHLHGSEAVLAALECAAGPLVEAESSPADLLARRALSQGQLALALEQRSHDFAAFLAEIERAPASERRRSAAAAVERSGHAMALAQPARLVLCGAQNAGKSTLMNRLLHRERALTGTKAGLTRDPVHEETVLDGYPYLLVDTAGEGAVSSDLDQRAVDLGRLQRAGSLQLVVVDGSRGPGALEARLAGAATLWVQNKIDLPQAPWPAELTPRVRVSCLDVASASQVRRVIGAQLSALRDLPEAGPVGGPAALSSEQYAQLRSLL